MGLRAATDSRWLRSPARTRTTWLPAPAGVEFRNRTLDLTLATPRVTDRTSDQALKPWCAAVATPPRGQSHIYERFGYRYSSEEITGWAPRVQRPRQPR